MSRAFRIKDIRVWTVSKTSKGGDYFNQGGEEHWLVDSLISNPMSSYPAYREKRAEIHPLPGRRLRSNLPRGGLAATILRAAFRSRIYVSNRETYPALTKALQNGGVHIRPHMIVPRL